MKTAIEKMGFNRREAAQYLGISENTLVDKLLKTGRIPFVKVDNGRIIISRNVMDRFMEGKLQVMELHIPDGAEFEELAIPKK